MRALPWNKFVRNNVGYLYAIAHGAQRVWDFDDDNGLIGPGDLLDRDALGGGAADQVHGWGEAQLIPYPVLGSTKFAWPRGLPLDAVQTAAASLAAATPFDASTLHDSKLQWYKLVLLLAGSMHVRAWQPASVGRWRVEVN